MSICASPPMTDCINCTPLRNTTCLASTPSREKYPECSATKVGSISGESCRAMVRRVFCACKNGASARKRQSKTQKKQRFFSSGTSLSYLLGNGGCCPIYNPHLLIKVLNSCCKRMKKNNM